MAAKITVQFTTNQFQFLVLVLCLLIFSATPLTFNFSSFAPAVTSNIYMEGDAYPDGSLRLTKSASDDAKNHSVGRATYRDAFLLRKNGILADFTSTFTFVISAEDPSQDYFADGLAFFLAPNGSSLNIALGPGSSLGLPVNNSLANYTMSSNEYPFVAVEFDIYCNREPSVDDPPYEHVGIDFNSVKSRKTEDWDSFISEGNKQHTATVSYNSSSKNLSVSFTTCALDEGGTTIQLIRNLYCLVDLLEYLPESVIVGFSASTGTAVALHKIVSWDFKSTLPPDYEPDYEDDLGRYNKARTEVGLLVGGCVTLLGVSAIGCFILYRKKRKTGNSGDDDTMVFGSSINEEFEKGTGPRKFSYNELARATSNFAQGEKLGEGGFGGVYRGFIKDLNSHVAVKKISKGSKQGLKEYAAEVSIISRLRHRNLVQLIGWCHEKKLLLVYEFMPNGSLDSHLFKEKSLLTWEVRYKIVQGLASGLLYLHQEWEQCVLHRDIKSSNIMLDANFNAKLGDFGLARLVDHGKMLETTIAAGTMGYMAMEYVTTGKASKESDVYSFGVVALEIACGRKAIDHRLEEKEFYLVEWVWELYGQGKIMEAADPKLGGEFDQKQMECLLMVGLWCSHPDYKSRSSIQQAIQVLNFAVPLPELPLKMPVAFAGLPLSFKQFSECDATGVQSEYLVYGTSINSSQFIPASTL